MNMSAFTTPKHLPFVFVASDSEGMLSFKAEILPIVSDLDVESIWYQI